MIEGILSTGINVVDIGLVTTPMLYFARILRKTNASIMVTASHNPKDDNGFKISFNSVCNAKGEEIFEFRDFLYKFEFDDGNGKLYKDDIKNQYFELFKRTLHFGNRRVKAVVDCGNGTTSIIARELYSMFPLDITMLYDESDGSFPNHHPDPIVEENILDLEAKVKELHADIGIGFDGDGDRAGFVLANGKMMTSDKYAVIVLRDLFKKTNNKKALYDIKCSSIVSEEIKKLGGTPYENRTGASYMMDAVMKNNIPFGIEYSGHIYFNDTFPPITSGLFAGLKLLEIMSKTNLSLEELYSGINKYYEDSEGKYPFLDDTKLQVVKKVKDYAISKNYKFSEIDGIKVYFSDGFALVRASNTGPNITTRFEAKTKERLEEIKKEFISIIKE